MTIDEMKLARDGHLAPLSVVGDPPKAPRTPWRPMWNVHYGADGLANRMTWVGPVCESRSADGWGCSGSRGHEDDHGARSCNWIIRWADDGVERYDPLGTTRASA